MSEQITCPCGWRVSTNRSGSVAALDVRRAYHLHTDHCAAARLQEMTR